MTDKAKILHHYLHAALWTEELDSEFDIKDFGPSTISAATKDVELFIEKAGKLLDLIDDAQIGHDFWLTRNHHGAGFWDRDLGEVGKKLTEIAQEFKEVNVFKNELDIIYFE